jgi:hypothetical protein
LGRQTVQLIEQLWDFGEESVFLTLLEDLRSYREQQNVNRAFSEAVNTQYARIVLEYAPLNPSPQQRDILLRAQQQVELEQEILALEPRLRRLRLNRAMPVPGFEFDIATAGIDGPVHQDTDLVRNLALEGDFEYIAEMFSTLPDCIPINAVATRSIQAALSQCGVASISSIPVGPTNQRFEWSWPGASFANAARIQIIDPNGDVKGEAFAQRGLNRGGVTFPIDDYYPDGSRIHISFGLTTKRGERVFSPFNASAPISVLARPSRKTSTSSSSQIGLLDRPPTLIPPRPPSIPSSASTGNENPPRTPSQSTQTVGQTHVGTNPPPPPIRLESPIKRFFSRFSRRK